MNVDNGKFVKKNEPSNYFGIHNNANNNSDISSLEISNNN